MTLQWRRKILLGIKISAIRLNKDDNLPEYYDECLLEAMLVPKHFSFVKRENIVHKMLLYRYWWNTRIFPFTKKSYLHRAQWRYYFYLSRVRILVSPWLLTWLANYKRASRSGARPVLLKFHSQNGFEVRRRYSYRFFDELPNFHIDTYSEREEHLGRFAEVRKWKMWSSL